MFVPHCDDDEFSYYEYQFGVMQKPCIDDAHQPSEKK